MTPDWRPANERPIPDREENTRLPMATMYPPPMPVVPLRYLQPSVLMNESCPLPTSALFFVPAFFHRAVVILPLHDYGVVCR